MKETLTNRSFPRSQDTSAPKRGERCWHTDHRQWLNSLDDNRDGWIRTTCKICGGFVGYRPGSVRIRRSAAK